ncbi:TAT-variant-translocated molybdopterin oxidoreductase [Luteolibacter yonseiensis]|uniref:TAT-variant-translocated molybdopterin oxidoreductase n=1 Tax=Luteolibacter yonseiensis TaxID=1144680 RepID=A0A934R4A9_9BACT|nr:TAT-variant-translocated molybdopterin oxidoreductase [Luteolibacter yonseiensis]MBK1815220.1 TAT-variant-translocated molybdopterin oxidoreductase [Luteolibacter yonseiensis]
MSKRIWHHPETPAGDHTVAWRSAGQLEDTAEFRQWMDREFPQGAAELSNPEVDETSRRSFLKLMGASTALAGFGMAACRRPESYIVPYTKAPEWVIPGKATYYASSMPRSGGATPLVVTTYEGRPTRVAPNNLHPDADGTDAFAQASVLDLYSPSRSKRVLKGGKAAKRADLDAVVAALAKDASAKVGFLFGTDDSPTRARLTKELAAKFSAAKFYQYEALSGESSIGDGVKLVADFSKADRILSLDCDFAETDNQGPVAAFFDRRKPEGKNYDSKPDASKMNRLYIVEAAFSLTGGMADHRLRVSPSQVTVVAAQIARALGVKTSVTASAPELKESEQIEWVNALAEDLKANAGKSLVVAGSRQPLALHILAYAINTALGNIGEGKPLAALQTETKGLGTLASLKSDIDSGAVETLILLTPGNPVYDAPADLKFAESFAKLKTSIHFGIRTDATAHASTWHVPVAHYLESWSDARSSRGTYTVVQPMILPLYPECVSELEILLALLSAEGKLLSGEGEKGAASPAYTAVRATFAALGGEGDVAWKKLLRDGFLADSVYPAATPTLRADVSAPSIPDAPKAESLEVIFATDSSVYDGRWIDNGWLQEAPDPISKITWDNAALIAPKTAKALGIYDDIITPEPVSSMIGIDGVAMNKFAKVGPDGEGENRKQPIIRIEVNGQSLEIAVLISFGQAENTIVIPLGYGQGYNADDELGRDTKNVGHVGHVGANTGFNAYPLRTAATSYFATGAKVSKTGKRYSVALTQEHSAMYGRALAREISTQEDVNKGDFSAQLANVAKQGNDSHAPSNISLYKPQSSSTFHPGKDGKPQSLLSDPLHQWGMSIDLSSCTGCNSCLIACQAENNIPIVGKEQVARGREMHWIRMDRYFATQDKYTDVNGKLQDTPEWVKDNPALVPQPVACVQCESAPCETVCPVNATIHTEDGLNAMAYNRCIGTRYCANNCPYKARRFNYFDYNKRNPLISHNLYKGPFGEKQVGEAPHLQRNPNVTVRMRGVMEKCTYCVQRLKDSVIRQKRGQKQEALVAGKPSTEMNVSVNTLRIPVDSVKVACQDACSAGAITFGNLLDGDKSVMVRSKHIERNYDLLNYIGTRPRTSYLARVKNPNPKMPDAIFIGKATVNMA